ncbi:hypothetical protein CJ030_MR2G027147 [Morella rubra]|uniref:Uncharacterized protein n=1 Tax=Morella rubra TaxID=262757 RepID=A0A6A1WCT3_9ROSI|nr:hypothetical protein CJ030_MR2G027147 [Morella rubra]
MEGASTGKGSKVSRSRLTALRISDIVQVDFEDEVDFLKQVKQQPVAGAVIVYEEFGNLKGGIYEGPKNPEAKLPQNSNGICGWEPGNNSLSNGAVGTWQKPTGNQTWNETRNSRFTLLLGPCCHRHNNSPSVLKEFMEVWYKVWKICSIYKKPNVA